MLMHIINRIFQKKKKGKRRELNELHEMILIGRNNLLKLFLRKKLPYLEIPG